MQGGELTVLETRFAEVAAEWASIAGAGALVDESRFQAVRADAKEIADAGNWTSGPTDLLSILGRQRDELFHSRMLAWLMSPTGRHGLGSRFLHTFLAGVLPADTRDLGLVVIELERTQAGINGETGERLEARADILVGTASALVVIENKLDAGEQPAQCERLYWAWANEPVETRFVFLTISGRPPGSAQSRQAREAWLAMSHRDAADALTAALAEAPTQTSTGRSTAQQYLATLRTQIIQWEGQR